MVAEKTGEGVLKKLQASVGSDLRRLEAFKRNRLSLLKQFVGTYYSENGAEKRNPWPALALAARIWSRHLVARAPTVLITPRLPERAVDARNLEERVNAHVREIELERTLAATVLDALFLDGYVKSGTAYAGEVEIDGRLHAVGESFADRVSIDDMILDMRAKDWRDMRYVGNEYLVPRKDAVEAYGEEVIDRLEKDIRGPMDARGQEKAASIGQGAESRDDDYRDEIRLIDLVLVRERVVLTVPARGEWKLLAERDWQGPGLHPYHRLSFGDVPDNLMPLAPMMLWRAMDEFVNLILRKLHNQAARMKQWDAVQGGAEADGNRAVRVNDGEVIRLDNPDGIRQIKSGGPDQALLAMFIKSAQDESWLMGQLDILGGMGAVSETVGQEKLVHEASNKMMAEMADRVTRLTKQVCGVIAWHEWAHPMNEWLLEKKSPSGIVGAHVAIGPEQRQGEFDFQYDIEPFSLQEQTPQSKLNALLMLLEKFLMPFGQMLQQQGRTIDFEEIVEKAAKWYGLKELSAILRPYVPPPQLAGSPGAEGPHMAPSTTRTNVRVSKTAASRQGKDQALIGSLLGQRLQEKEAGGMA